MAEDGVDLQFANIVAAMALAVSDAIHTALDAATDLDRSAATALIALSDLAHASSVQRLSMMLGVTHSGCVRLVDRLTRDGLVERRPGPDGRTHAVALTSRGRRVAEHLRNARRDAVAATVRHLDIEQQSLLLDVSRHVIATAVGDRLELRREGRAPAGGALCRMCDPVACGRAAGLCPALNAAGDSNSS